MSSWPEIPTNFKPAVQAPDQYASAWFFAFHHNEILLALDDEGLYCPLSEDRIDQIAHGKRHFMGMYQDIACFAVEVDKDDEYQFSGLRSLFGKSDNFMFSLAGRAHQICEWYRTHQFCGKCGAQTIEHERDRAMVCDNCGIHSYPRLSPSIIVLVHQQDQVLLARNIRFPAGMYSTLAGFVEPGESIEETLVREVKEEVGVDVGNLEYLGSQPWPFPNSLMLGFHAEYLSGDIVLQEDEIADAQWFSINDLPEIPGNVAISRWLIDDYLRKKGVIP